MNKSEFAMALYDIVAGLIEVSERAAPSGRYVCLYSNEILADIMRYLGISDFSMSARSRLQF